MHSPKLNGHSAQKAARNNHPHLLIPPNHTIRTAPASARGGFLFLQIEHLVNADLLHKLAHV